MSQGKTVFVGLSGGVDSSVAALRLKNEGYNVVGVFIKVWHPDFLDCNWEAERLDAMRVAAHLDIPFLMCDAEQAYKDNVADYFISEYKAGRTPNPDVMCNSAVKFGAFLAFALNRGADYIATGHYAQKTESSDREGNIQYELHRGVDTNKDQTYFLWTLTQAQLRHVLLPVGKSTKEVIRKEAAATKIPVATKKDSQGICFLGHIDIPDFLSHYIPLAEGNILNETGEEIGTHGGAFVYTIGQRHGFTLHIKSDTSIPHYVVNKDIRANTITVSQKQPEQKSKSNLILKSVNYIAYTPNLGDVIDIQTRYHQNPVSAAVISVTEHKLTLALQETHEMSAVGQSCVLYRGMQCLGGGIISA